MSQGTATRLLAGGEALVRIDGESVLVANAVPGDELKLKLSGQRRGVMRGDIVEVLCPSGQRVQASCPVAAECGGC
ncbi:MAG: 23S rRNA methyltransferase, partial [Mariprofundaceae bacterium]|nr:23S rRNA methyltransferase [Mariprofundaceae bacterium]